jgi:hypothetical protein
VALWYGGVKLLFDTHLLLSAAGASDRLSVRAKPGVTLLTTDDQVARYRGSVRKV